MRTKNGEIDRIYEYKKDTKMYICEKDLMIDSQNLLATHIKDIVKHSKNIIDLLEVGDIVNNGYIYEIGNAENGDTWVHNLNGLLLYNEDIKKILTHEKYEKECYRIGE